MDHAKMFKSMPVDKLSTSVRLARDLRLSNKHHSIEQMVLAD